MRQGLGLDQFYLLGHSWGGLLAIEYALKYQQYLKGLVISNMAASSESSVKHVSKIRAQFPESVRGELERCENANKTDDPGYQKLLFESCSSRNYTRSSSVDSILSLIQCSADWMGGINMSITFCREEANSKPLAE